MLQLARLPKNTLVWWNGHGWTKDRDAGKLYKTKTGARKRARSLVEKYNDAVGIVGWELTIREVKHDFRKWFRGEPL